MNTGCGGWPSAKGAANRIPSVRAAEAAARKPNPGAAAAGEEKRGEGKSKTKSRRGRSDETFQDRRARAVRARYPRRLSAQDTLKIAIGQINNWENQAPTLGEDAGIFKKHNLKIEAFGTQGAGETIQAVVSGSADLGAGVGVAGVMRAFSRGAPVRVLLPAFTGTGDLYWYVKADSPIKSLKDTTAQPDHRVFDQRLELAQHRGGVRPGTRRQGEGDRDRRAARDLHAGDDRADRHRLVGAAVRHQGDQGRQDPHRGARQRHSLAEGADRARDHRQCRMR